MIAANHRERGITAHEDDPDLPSFGYREHPIIQGGMTWIANAELAAAVSNADGSGIIGPNAGMALEADLLANLRSQIRKAKALTARPFG